MCICIYVHIHWHVYKPNWNRGGMKIVHPSSSWFELVRWGPDFRGLVWKVVEMRQASSWVLIIIWLVVGPPLWKIWTSFGMMRFPRYGKIKLMATKPPTSYSKTIATHSAGGFHHIAGISPNYGSAFGVYWDMLWIAGYELHPKWNPGGMH